MSKKTLEQKITCVKLSAFIFAIGYFLLGVILKRTGPKFDPDKAYDLITTSLTLTAYFLAPVAAFVLFSDWREQHREKKQEEMSENILKNLIHAYNSSFVIRMKINDKSLYEDDKNIQIISDQFRGISLLLSEARGNLDVLKERLSPEINSFISTTQKLLDNNFSMWLGNLSEMFNFQKKYNSVLPDESYEEYDQYNEYCIEAESAVWVEIKNLKAYQKEMLIL